ncbi:hypothetical protein TB1_006571 [Malus domestica]
MGDPLGSSRVSSQKQTVMAWSGPKTDNIVLRQSRARDMMEGRAGPGCDNLVSEPIFGRKCADEDIGPLRGWIVTSYIIQESGSSKPYMYILISS